MEKLKAGGEGGNRMRWLDGITFNGHESEQTPEIRRTGKPDLLQSTGVPKSQSDTT